MQGVIHKLRVGRRGRQAGSGWEDLGLEGKKEKRVDRGAFSRMFK